MEVAVLKGLHEFDVAFERVFDFEDELWRAGEGVVLAVFVADAGFEVVEVFESAGYVADGGAG